MDKLVEILTPFSYEDNDGSLVRLRAGDTVYFTDSQVEKFRDKIRLVSEFEKRESKMKFETRESKYKARTR